MYHRSREVSMYPLVHHPRPRPRKEERKGANIRGAGGLCLWAVTRFARAVGGFGGLAPGLDLTLFPAHMESNAEPGPSNPPSLFFCPQGISLIISLLSSCRSASAVQRKAADRPSTSTSTMKCSANSTSDERSTSRSYNTTTPSSNYAAIPGGLQPMDYQTTPPL